MRKVRAIAFSVLVMVTSPALAEAPGSPSGERLGDRFTDWRLSRETPSMDAPAVVVVSKAGDALGRPIDLSRVRSAGALSGRTGIAAITTLPTARPLASSIVTSGFGLRRHPLFGGRRAHLGLDLAAPIGAPVVATSDGMVSVADWNGGYGLYVALDHGGGVQTRYGHMSRLNVIGGQQVRKGDVIGFVGSTGHSTGPHLHYEVRMNGQAVNPALVSSGRR